MPSTTLGIEPVPCVPTPTPYPLHSPAYRWNPLPPAARSDQVQGGPAPGSPHGLGEVCQARQPPRPPEGPQSLRAGSHPPPLSPGASASDSPVPTPADPCQRDGLLLLCSSNTVSLQGLWSLLKFSLPTFPFLSTVEWQIFSFTEEHKNIARQARSFSFCWMFFFFFNGGVAVIHRNSCNILM